jgi:peptidyl-prolyl cis-trans isomerase C
MLIVRAARVQGLHNGPGFKQQVANMEGQILEQSYLRSIIKFQVTDEALRKDYQKSVAAAATGGEVEVRARHILVKTEAEAMAIIEDLINNTADFEALARAKSTGPSSTRGGDLGFFAKGAMVKPFADAAFAMKPGEITSKPAKTQFGWHVIKLKERRAGSVPSFEKSRKKLSGEMTQRVIAEAVGSLRKNAAVETFGLDGGIPAPARIQRVQ